ncbi:MAG: transporter family protein [Herbinix sp.]|nr:transporter family protein [Herbinix sp.]
MQHKKYNIISAVNFCFRFAPRAATIKLLIEIINGALIPLMVLVISSFINNAVTFVNGDGKLAPVIVMLILMAGYYGYSQVNQIILRIANKTLENALREYLRPQLVEKQARTSFELLENPETMDLILRVCTNVEDRMMAILDSSIGIIRLGIQVFGTLSLLAIYVWWMLPLFIASAFLIAFIARKGGKAIYASDVVTTKLTRRHYYLSSILVGRETAAERTLFGYGDYINEKFSAAHLKRSNIVTKEIAIEEITVNTCGLILNALVLVAVLVLLRPVGEKTMSHGLYVSIIGALIGLAKIITGTVSRLVCETTGYIEYMRDYTTFFSLTESDTNNNVSGNGKVISFTSLEIRNLRFRYTPESNYVLNGVNLIIEKGKSYSLIGKNGAGKSTLIKILLGFYRDFEGEILINGVDISKYNSGDLRQLFSIVYQDFAKYYIPLINNITLGSDRNSFRSSICLAELEDVVAKLPKNENTPLGKIYVDGTDLSGGEWQKVAIARALYADTPFMILDEPTASLSPMMESKLYKRFTEITKNKTSLLISHRLGSTKLSDMLFVLDNGVIAETGTHDELMAAKGIYSNMFNSQRSWYDER